MLRPGEYAVLKNGDGGRLFEVAEVDEPDAEGRFRVREVPWMQGQPKHEVWNDQLVEVVNKAAAERLVELLKAVAEERDRKLRAVRAEAESEFRRIIAEHERKPE